MAAASYLSDVLQESYEPKLCVTKFIESLIRIFKISEAIQNLPLKIREKNHKEFVTIKLRERKEMGWNEVHNDIEEAPFCEKRLRITKVCFCRNCTSCRINGRCYECYKHRENHYLDFTYPTYDTYNENFQKIYWAAAI